MEDRMITSAASSKTMRDQVRELRKLVLDAQDQLDLAVRGLQMLEDHLNTDVASANPPSASHHAEP
jgi:hypothetical protein